MKIRTEADFDQLLRGAKLLAIAAAWNELGLWDELAGRHGPVDLTELPADPRALSITAPILAHAGLLDGAGDRWAISATARALYERGEMPTERNLDMLEDLRRMSDVLREGGPVRGPDGESKATQGGIRTDDPERSRRFLDMLYRRSGPSAEVTADWLAERCPAGGHVIDIGGGHGRYAETFAQRGFQATLFDFPLVIEYARERRGDALSYRSGDFHTDELGGPYDAALLSNVVHGEPDEGNAGLVARVYDALRPGGWIVLKDMFIDEQGRDPESAVFFGATMLYYTSKGHAYTFRDVERWCAGAGFNGPDAVSVDTFSLIFARKPT